MKSLFVLVFPATALLFAACNKNAGTAAERCQTTQEHLEHGNAESPDGLHYGAVKTTTEEGAVALSAVLTKLKNKEGMSEMTVTDNDVKAQGFKAKVQGTVTEVCQKAGCWFRMTDGNGAEVFFKMKNHMGIPTSFVGKTVVVEGVAYENVTSVEELRHYAEDKNASKEEIEAIKEPKVEYKFYAEGVLLKP